MRKYHVLLVALLLIAGQFVSLVHATEHPFHDHGEICEILSALEQHDASIAVVGPSDDFLRYNDVFRITYQSRHAPSITNTYPARGPPEPTQAV